MALLMGVLLSAGTAWGQLHELAKGTATVDGDLSDWANASWLTMDQVYHGEPNDISTAKWTARWMPDMIYVAVTVTDLDHVFNSTHQGWDAQDAAEFYIDAGNKETSGYQTTFADAQEFVGSPDGTPDGEWLMLGLDPLPEDAVAAFETSVDGSVINYEIAMRPYDSFDKDDPASSTLLTLSAGMTIGLDVVVDTRYTDDGFGMLCQNEDTSKWTYAEQYLDHLLVGGLDGDLNDDGFVGGDDLDIVRSYWGQHVTSGNLLQGDPSNDGFVGGDDLDIVRANWGQGTPPVPTAIPEPGAVFLLAAGALGLLLRLAASDG